MVQAPYILALEIHDRFHSRRESLAAPAASFNHHTTKTKLLTRYTRHSIRLAVLLIVTASMSVGCGDSSRSTEAPIAFQGGANPAVTEPKAVLQIYALDIWAQPLPANITTLTMTPLGKESQRLAAPIATVGLTDARSYTIDVESADHAGATLVVVFDGSTQHDAVRVLLEETAVEPGLTVGHSTVTNDAGNEVPVYSVYVGLPHLWFSSQGAPARRGNNLQLYIDGEAAWAQVAQDIKAATDSALVSTWWWDSEFELVRDPVNHHSLTPQQRWKNTAMGVLESSPLHIRLLVGEFWGTHEIADWLTTDKAAEHYAEHSDDAFEVMGQGNPTADIFLFEPKSFVFGDRVRSAIPETAAQSFDEESAYDSFLPTKTIDLSVGALSVGPQAASWHQKFMVLDGSVAFVGGMNIKGVDWDTAEHKVFDHRRMSFDASQDHRQSVMLKKASSDFGPRKDYIVRVDGPSAQDVAGTFQQRWHHQLDNGAAFSQNSSAFAVNTDIPPKEDGVEVQVTTTMPSPLGEQSIAETWLKAVAQAEEYILIEDQYWRAPLLVEAILERMAAVPSLRLIVITKPVDEWLDPGCEWTHVTHEWLKTKFSNRYSVYQLRSFQLLETWGFSETEGHFVNMDVHSKMFMVDDKFMSVGSCNKNNRGLLYEGEMNVAVFDADWVRAQRKKILANILPPNTPAADSVEEWSVQLEMAAAINAVVFAKWEEENFDLNLSTYFGSKKLPDSWLPTGFVYPLDFGLPAECLIQGSGPDFF